MNNKVQEFYNNFLDSRMLSYRMKGNERIDRAIERISKNLKVGDKVFDVGCGIGIIAEKVSESIGASGHVWACDISDKNIWYAKKTVKNKNIDFFQANIIEDQSKIKQFIPKNSLDVIYLVDVIEHIPIDEHQKIFYFFKYLLKNSGKVILTYPSPQYQKYLMENKTDELQIIDQIIEFDHLKRVAENCELSLKLFSLETVFNKQNHYVHCIFQVDNSLKNIPSQDGFFLKKLFGRLKKGLKKTVIYPYKKYKYIYQVFKKS